MQKRLLALPLVWAAFGIGEVLALNYLLGPIVNNLPYGPNDKPIGGSYLPVLFFNVAALFVMFGLSLWALGIWNIDLSSRKTRTDFAALGVLLVAGLLVFYTPIAFFAVIVSLIYLLAVNID